MVYTIFHPFFIGVIMTKPKTTTEKPVPTTKEVPVAAKATKPAPKKTSTGPASQKKVETVVANTKVEQPIEPVVIKSTPEESESESLAPEKVRSVESKLATATSELSINERIGLTAGSIWRYLSENGTMPVTKIVSGIDEEEKIIQRSIGWLAQEGKITVGIVDRIETIGLNN
jgi:hypothetical protein